MAFKVSHYYAISGVIRTTKNKEEVAEAFAKMLEDDASVDGHGFNRSKFLEQCGVKIKPVKAKPAPKCACKPAKAKSAKTKIKKAKAKSAAARKKKK